MLPILTKKEAEKIEKIISLRKRTKSENKISSEKETSSKENVDSKADMNSKDELKISLDLGLTTTSVFIDDKNLILPTETQTRTQPQTQTQTQKLPLTELSKIKESCCYVVDENILKKIAFFSDETNFYYKLTPSVDWPTMMLSSTPMHRHTKISPRQDTILKIKEISPVKGRVLDTCGGLGYTAILSAKNAAEVYTFERDKNVLHLASFNPYSKELFTNKRIKIIEKDIFDEIKKFKDGFFDRIIHDPPTFKYSPLIYSREFYRELFRVLKKGGIIYHYSPLPHKTKGNTFYKGIMQKMKEIGFQKIEYKTETSGIRAVKI